MLWRLQFLRSWEGRSFRVGCVREKKEEAVTRWAGEGMVMTGQQTFIERFMYAKHGIFIT